MGTNFRSYKQEQKSLISEVTKKIYQNKNLCFWVIVKVFGILIQDKIADLHSTKTNQNNNNNNNNTNGDE